MPDFDLSGSGLSIGIEVEYPAMDRGDTLFVDRGRDTSGIQNDMGRLPSHINGRPTYDGTVGLEIVSDRLHLEDAPQWYADVIEFVENEYDARHQPSGLMFGGSTAGLHIHMSPLNDAQARRLHEISQQPWAKVLFCSSITASEGNETWPVFRGGRYCRMNQYNDNRYSCVNARGSGHYEWRMPEPMTPEHMEIVVRFLRAFEQDPDEAVEYAQQVLDDADERITAIRRAEATGMDIEGVPIIERSPHEEDPEHFFEEVQEQWALPEIYHVEYGDSAFYTFNSVMDAEWEVAGVTFSENDVIRADELEHVADETLAAEVRTVFENRRDGSSPRRETDATHELKKIVKKKKGKS